MPPQIASPQVARVGPTVATSQTTAGFDAPAGGYILSSGVIDTSGTTNATATFTNSGTALTWQQIARQGSNESGARPGTVVLSLAAVPSARTAMTNTLTSSITGRNTTIKPLVLTNVDLTTPVGATVEGSAPVGTNVLTTSPLITQAADSLVVFLANESELGPGLPTSPDATIDAYVSSGNHSGALGWRTTGAAGESVTFTLDAAGASTAVSWNWVVVEIRVAPTPPTSDLNGRRRRNRPLLVR